jgi:spore coat protein H
METNYPQIKGQSFYGFQKLSFSSNVIDKSFMREKVVGDLLREYGVRAARTTWVRVYLDYGSGSQYFGLYTMVEIPDQAMLDSQFGGSSGNLYKPQGSGANLGPRSSVDSTTWQETFEKETNATAADWSDVANAVDALNADTRTTATATWRSNLETYFNVDKFLKWMSANAILGNGDTYGLLAHNYYLYGDPNDNQRINWIPWDHDLALTCGTLDITYPATSYSASSWPLFRYLMDDSTYNSTYRGYASAFLNHSVFNTSNLNARLDAAYALIEPYVTGANGEQIGTAYSALDSTADYGNAITSLKSVITARHTNVAATLGE